MTVTDTTAKHDPFFDVLPYDGNPVLDAAFNSVVEYYDVGTPVPAEVVQDFQATLKEHLLEKFPIGSWERSAYRQFGRVIQGDIIHFIGKLGMPYEELVEKDAISFTKGAESYALEDALTAGADATSHKNQNHRGANETNDLVLDIHEGAAVYIVRQLQRYVIVEEVAPDHTTDSVVTSAD